MIFGLFRKANPVVSEVTGRDAPHLAAIHAAGFERGWDTDEFERMLAERNIVCQVTRRAGRGSPTGFIMSRHVADEAEILTVAVHGKWRGRGLATLLLRSHLSRLAARGVQAAFLEVAEDNKAALTLYRRAGFAEIGRRQGYYSRPGRAPATAIVMKRALR